MTTMDDTRWSLAGKQVVFAGRLAALKRSEAEALVAARGASCGRGVTSSTDVVVLGQDGLPLTRSGQLSRKLRRARRLQGRTGAPLILTEDEFFERLGLPQQAREVRRLYSPAQLGRALGITRSQLRGWQQAGLIVPARTLQGVAFFEFRQVAAMRTLVSLARSGVTIARMRRNLELLRRCLPHIDNPLDQLTMLERDGKMLFRLEDGLLAEPSGQLALEYPDDEPATLRPAPPTPDECWQAGLAHEEAGRLDDAAASYRQALRLGGPDAQLCFNLGNVLAKQEQPARAVERFYQALELEPAFAEAWNNLGNALVELRAHDEAVSAYREALALDAHYGDAHYNLADLLEELGRHDSARAHWQAFLGLETRGAWADHARRRLAARQR
jgi:tetratricopeptide (TPR) repeat protein